MTTQQQFTRRFQPETRPAVEPKLAGERISDFADIINEHTVQAPHILQRDAIRQPAPVRGELERVWNYASLRHKGRMILFSPYPVKRGSGDPQAAAASNYYTFRTTRLSAAFVFDDRVIARTFLQPPLPPMKLVLASTSAYRRMLLERFCLPFETARPDVDETPLPDETPPIVADRLAAAKARAVAGRFPAALIVGSDQVAHIGGEIFGKPGTVERAVEQLRRMRGRTVTFHTALALFNSASGRMHSESVPTRVKFRDLSDDEIHRYVERERPLDCAGSAKSEGLGITLLDSLSGDDPTALVGLPLIALSRMLRAEGVVLP